MNNQLTAGEIAAVEKHITECAECRSELAASTEMWDLLEGIKTPEPGANMQVKFDVMLDVYKKSLADKKKLSLGVFYKLKQLFIMQPRFAMGYSIILIAIGVGSGLMVGRPVHPMAAGGKVDSLAAQVHDLKEAVTLALLQNPSASERIRGVSFTSEIKGENKNVINALFTTLNNDDNPNVRIVTLEALVHYASDPAVREGLVESILQQDSPLVQSALADIMLKLQEKKSVQPFKKLLQQKDLNNLVRSKIEETINHLI